MLSRVYNVMPGLHTLVNYQRHWLADDAKAVLSVAAVALLMHN